MTKTKRTRTRRAQKRHDLEDQHLEIVRMIRPVRAVHNSWLLWEQPETIIGQNFTTYSAGEIPTSLTLQQR